MSILNFISNPFLTINGPAPNVSSSEGSPNPRVSILNRTGQLLAEGWQNITQKIQLGGTNEPLKRAEESAKRADELSKLREELKEWGQEVANDEKAYGQRCEAAIRIVACFEDQSTELNLDGLELTSLPPQIWQLRHVRHLRLGDNNLRTLPPEIIAKFQSFQEENMANGLQVWCDEVKETAEYQNRCIAKEKILQCFQSSSSILILKGLGLTDLPPEIGQLTTLRILDLSHNQLTALPPEFGNLAALKILGLNNNRLIALSPEFGNLTNLQTLDLKDNELRALPPEFGSLTNLENLNLSNNHLTALCPEFGNLTNLQTLDLKDNELRALPSGFGSLTNLENLNLSNNHLTDLQLIWVKNNFYPILSSKIEQFLHSVGDIYEGQLPREAMHEQEIYTFPKRNIYESQFHRGEIQEQGICYFGQRCFANGDIYHGEFHRGEIEGQGMMLYSNGDIYEGQFHRGERHGQGIQTYSNGDVFIGSFRSNKREGIGLHLLGKANPNEPGCIGYKGNYVNGHITQGEITFYGSKQIQKCILENKTIINLNRFNIGDFLFFSLLYGVPTQNKAQVRYGYNLPILADYLRHYFENSPESLKIINPLLELNYLRVKTDTEKTKHILSKLYENESCLLQYGCHGHAMLLNLIPSKNSNFIDLEIFNSGGGLEKYHIKDQKTGKYQTKKIIRIPKSELTAERLNQIINRKRFPSVDKAYQIFLDIPGAECIEQKNPIYQKSQASNNCSLECYFAYLRDKLPLVIYKKMRKDLFQDSLHARMEQEKGSIEQSGKKEPRVQDKILSLNRLPDTPYGKRRRQVL